MPQVKKGTKGTKDAKNNSKSRFTDGKAVTVDINKIQMVNTPKKKK